MRARLRAWLRARLARFAPRCIVLVIFSDGSFLAAKFSRLEPAAPRIEIESRDECGSIRSACELVANFGSVRIYRLVTRPSAALPPDRVPARVN